jgi:hypothetical protein
LIGHLGQSEASCIAYTKERNVNDTGKKTQARNLSKSALQPGKVGQGHDKRWWFIRYGGDAAAKVGEVS